MNTYSQWHEEDNIVFHNQTMVYFGQCKKNRLMGLDDLLRITSDVAVQEYNSKGISREKLLENNFAILVSRVAFRFHKLPHENQNITVSTWEETSDALQLYRQYEIKDTDTNESLVTGYSSWLLVDPKARRILPTKKFTLRPPVSLKKGHDCMEPGKIVLPEGAVLLDERKIRYSDLDANGHTTNSRYGAFILDCLPQEYLNKEYTDFKINFSKEAMLGQTLKIYAFFDTDSKKIILQGTTEQGSSFESELYYK